MDSKGELIEVEQPTTRCEKHRVLWLADHCPQCRKEAKTEAAIKDIPSLPSILSEAESIINGPRREAYGPVEESFERLATAYSLVLFKKLKEPITAHEAALLGVALKMCREANKPAHDNRLDLCGYAALADKVAPKEEK